MERSAIYGACIPHGELSSGLYPGYVLRKEGNGKDRICDPFVSTQEWLNSSVSQLIEKHTHTHTHTHTIFYFRWGCNSLSIGLKHCFILGYFGRQFNRFALQFVKVESAFTVSHLTPHHSIVFIISSMPWRHDPSVDFSVLVSFFC
jgi:hypothetical protein